MNHKFLKITLLCLCWQSLVFAQDSITYLGEEKAGRYKAWAFSFGVDMLTVRNQQNLGAKFFHLEPSFPVNFGLNYRLLTHKDWSLRAGLYFRIYGQNWLEQIDPQELPRPLTPIKVRETPFNNWRFHIMAERHFALSNKIDFTLGAGFESIFYREEDIIGQNTLSFNDTLLIDADEFSGSTNWYFGPNVEAGLDYKFNQMLLRFKIMYHHNISENQYTFIVRTSNFLTSPDTEAKKRLTGNFWGVSLTAHPARDFFKKKDRSTPKEPMREFKTAKKTFDTYSRWGLAFEFDRFFDQSELILNRFINRFDAQNTNTYNFGLNYVFATPGSFSFTAGMYYSRFSPDFRIRLMPEETGLTEPIDLRIKPKTLNRFRVNLLAEYHIPLNEKLNLLIGIGGEYNTKDNRKSLIIPLDFPNGSSGDFFVQGTEFSSNEENIGAIGQLGIDYKTEYALMRLRLKYNRILTGTSNLAGVNLSNDDFSILKADGWFGANYWGIQLNIHPKRGLFKKKPL